MDDYLSKPVTSEVLRLKLDQWIKPAARPEDAPPPVGEILWPVHPTCAR